MGAGLIRKYLVSAWRLLRRLSGDDAYERYLDYFCRCPQHQGAQPLSRQAFFKKRQDEKWRNINRCC